MTSSEYISNCIIALSHYLQPNIEKMIYPRAVMVWLQHNQRQRPQYAEYPTDLTLTSVPAPARDPHKAHIDPIPSAMLLAALARTAANPDNHGNQAYAPIINATSPTPPRTCYSASRASGPHCNMPSCEDRHEQDFMP